MSSTCVYPIALGPGYHARCFAGGFAHVLRWLRVIVRLVLLALLAFAALAETSSVFQQVDEMVTSLSSITGWKILKRVPSEMLSKDTFRRYVESRMKESSSKEETRAEELTLKMFGFVPQDFNLEKETVDLVSEQAAAFYDYNKKRLYILDSTTEGTEQRVALVHELAHALADQQHPLGKYLHKGSPDDDASTARQAVMEGQATWLTWAYVSKRNGGKAEVPPQMIDELTKTLGADGADFPVFTNAPLYMRESLVFPYNEGLRFQDAVFRKLGRDGFDSVFTRPPASTQQILHPDAYLADKKPSEPEPPSLESFIGKKLAKNFHVLGDGSLGEFDHSVLLRTYIGEKEGAEAATHWHGGAYRLYENKHEKYGVLTYISEWDSPEAALDFFRLYQLVMKGRWKKMNLDPPASAEAVTRVTGSGDTGRFELSVSGITVQSIEGLK